MTEHAERLSGLLTGLGRQARSARWVRLSGWSLLACGVTLFLLLGYRRYHLEHSGADLIGLGAVWTAVLSAGAVGTVLLLVRLAVKLGGPATADVARIADRKLELKNLAVSGLGAIGGGSPLAGEVVLRAAGAIEDVEPASLFPTGRGLLRHAAAVPFVLAALYLFALPPWAGLDPTRRGAGLPSTPPSGDQVPAEPEAEPEPGAGETDVDEPDDPEAEPEEGPPPDLIGVKVVPAKTVYEPTDPVTVFVLASPGEENVEEHEFSVTLVVDGEPADLGRSVKVGIEDPGFLTVQAKHVGKLREKLTPGKHMVSAILTENGQSIESEAVEIEIRSDDDGDGQPPPPPPPPQPPPEGGEPPPPETEETPRFVNPLFGPGETVTKKGYALVPDPEAPAGSPPRRLPIGEAAKEAARRPETEVATEKIRPQDRETVAKYFDLLRGDR